MRLIGRLFLLFAGCALVAWGVWTFVLGRPGMQRELFERAAEARYRAAQPRPVDAAAFRATACALSPCVLVEAGGLSLLFGAGAGAADGLYATGLLRTDLDGVFLTGLRPADVAGLAELSQALAETGRTSPLVVHGPAGVDSVVAGLNALLAGPSQVAASGPDPSGGLPRDVALATGERLEIDEVRGALVFDSGVVSVRMFPATAPDESVFRVEWRGRALIVGGCGARREDVLAAARGAAQAAAILPASSAWMLGAQKAAATSAGMRHAWPGSQDPALCLTPEDAVAAFREVRLAGGMLTPLYPPPVDQATRRLWNETAPEAEGLRLVLGGPGATLDFGPDLAPERANPAARPAEPGTPP